MKFSKFSTLFFLFLVVLPATVGSAPLPENMGNQGEQRTKEPSVELVAVNQLYSVPDANSRSQQCIEQCLHQNQRIAMGYEAILEICSKECDFEQFLAMALSNSNDDRVAGIKGLCASQNPGAVQPLINALQKDLGERFGMWAWIIPALGASRDQGAVPVLTKTLTLMDEDWLGREMSARALGDIGDPSSVPVLLAAAWRADTRSAAIESLAQFRDKRVVPVLISALAPDEDPQARKSALTGLQNLGSMAVPEMMEAFTDFSPEFPQTQKRLELYRLLAASGDERALSMLRENINDPDKSIRECVKEYGR